MLGTPPKTVSIIQSSYIPWKGYFDIIDRSDEFVLLDSVPYSKGSWRNRNKIKTPEGVLWLTIPVNRRFLDAVLENFQIDTAVSRSDQYPQIHGEFRHDVSIIDLIFTEGPNARRFLSSAGITAE